MGAALTYARRYALFTLVGIAGEDDLDAPDLPTSRVSGAAPASNRHGAGQANGHAAAPAPAATTPIRRKLNPPTSKPMLDATASAAACAAMLAELAGVAAVEDLDRWAYRCLPTKNRLTTNDARQIEDAFDRKLTALRGSASPEIGSIPSLSLPTPLRPYEDGCGAQQTKIASHPIDKSLLAIPEPRRVRDKTHLRFVAKQACLICGRRPCDAHHLRFAQSRGLGLKVSDEFTVPLCRGHHREVHRFGIEANWWKNTSADRGLNMRVFIDALSHSQPPYTQTWVSVNTRYWLGLFYP